MATVRDATYEVLRRRGLTTLFSNPGSTEVPFLVDLPDDLEFVLGLHEGSVVGMATGCAIGRRAPALVLLHTTAGLGNGVAALATARVNRVPLVVLVGQQDRRHLAFEPFLAGRLDGLGGEYPVGVERPARAQDVPAAIERAFHQAETARGPALVVVPMDDWAQPAAEAGEHAAAGTVHRAPLPPDAAGLGELARLLDAARAPALVAGAGAVDAWDELVALAEALRCPVFQESFGGRAGFPQDHPHFAGHLPADRTRLRERLAPFDVVLAVGAPIFRQSPYHPGPFVEAGTRLAIVSDDPAELHRSPGEAALLADPARAAGLLAEVVRRREGPAPEPFARPPAPEPGEPLTTAHLFSALAERLPRDVVFLEECPSSRPELEKRVPARTPLGYVSAAMGGLGFAMPAAVGLRMALPDRPVVAVVGDGSAMYQVQALWSAATYGAGALFVVVSNGGYAIMDRLAEHRGGSAPWPGFDVDVAGIARALGCEGRRIETHADLVGALDDTLPGLAARESPLLLDVAVLPDAEFAP
jgi:benzoylformate decarboxylase